jgi:DMSO/TMAO reductase YedYZ molybdopterin-dependent catalytic subunit
MADDERLKRIVEARLRLKARHVPATDPSSNQGSGPLNRHGKPQLPVGQTYAKTWPVLDLGEKPDVSLAQWSLKLDGAVEAPVTLDWAAFRALPQHEDLSDFHCVTTWSLMDSRWKGVQFSTLAALARPLDSATHVMAHAYDGYSTNLPLDEALKDDVLLVYEWNGQPLPRDHGGPVRMITPQLYAWKGAKWINRIEFMVGNRRGFWEERGYSDTADPWRDDRYS